MKSQLPTFNDSGGSGSSPEKAKRLDCPRAGPGPGGPRSGPLCEVLHDSKIYIYISILIIYITKKIYVREISSNILPKIGSVRNQHPYVSKK